MSFSENYNFVPGNEDLEQYHMFSFGNISNGTINNDPFSTENLLCAPRLASPSTVQRQVVGCHSPSAASPAGDLDTVNFDDFLVLDESINNVSVVAEEAPPPESAIPSNRQDETAATPRQSEGRSVTAELMAAQAEIARLETGMATKSLQHEPLVASGGCESSCPPQQKSTSGEVSPLKRQIITQVGPIEALWSPKVTESERRTILGNLASPTIPKPSQAHLDFTSTSLTPYLSSQQDCEISAEDLQSIQTFLRDNPTLVHSTSHHVSTAPSSSNITMPRPVSGKVKRAPLKHAPRRAPNTTTKATTKVTKKPKTSSKQTQHRRATSAASIATPTTPPEPVPTHHRSIDELLAANFYSLNEQEKCRVLLPMLRNLDPRELEASLAELPCIQAKGAGHEARVTRAIQDSPPSSEGDDILATKLTTGTPPSPTPAAKTSTTPSPTTALQASPLAQQVTKVEVGEDHGALRQREALEKAALLQTQGKNR